MKDILQSSVQKLDIIIWIITLSFFLVSAWILGWDIQGSFIGALGIIVLMFFVGLSIELILSALKHVKWLGAITGFITNGPEALVLIVWLITGNVLFAASTPLGSNVMNPILLILALIVSGLIVGLKDFKYKLFFIASFIITGAFAIGFFFIPESWYFAWIIIAGAVSIALFRKKFDYQEESVAAWESASRLFLPIGVIILLVSGYFLDPVVWYTAEASKSPKWLIWFLVLATLTSWPEFKSVLSLFSKWKTLDGFVNIFVSNITNIWLAAAWVFVWLMIK